MMDDRRHWPGASLHADRHTLHARPGIIPRLLIGALGDRDALHADPEPFAVHHCEHGFEAAVFVADAPADRALTLAIGHDASRRRVNAELFFQAQRPQIVTLARPSFL